MLLNYVNCILEVLVDLVIQGVLDDRQEIKIYTYKDTK